MRIIFGFFIFSILSLACQRESVGYGKIDLNGTWQFSQLSDHSHASPGSTIPLPHTGSLQSLVQGVVYDDVESQYSYISTTQFPHNDAVLPDIIPHVDCVHSH